MPDLSTAIERASADASALPDLIRTLDQMVQCMSRDLMRSRSDLCDDLAQEIRAHVTSEHCALALERARAAGTAPINTLRRILRDHGRQVAPRLRGTGIVGDGSGRATECLRRRLQRIEALAAQERRELSDADICEQLGIGDERLLTLRRPVQLVYDASEDIIVEAAPEEACDLQREFRTAQELVARGSRRARRAARDLVGADVYELLVG